MISRMAADNANRSRERSAPVVMRLTREKREELKAIAKSHGLTVQAYLEKVAFGLADVEERRPGRPVHDPELFSMTG